jgi:4-oxalocrotonate tautomerase
MPVIRVAMFPGRTDEQKERLALRITQAFVEEAGGKPESVHVLFEEIAKSDWAVAGKLASQPERRS